MELQQLRYVAAVVDEGSFTAAAARLHVAQSGVSQQVRKLERELGVRLLDRSTRRVALTPEGRRILPSLRAALEGADAAMSKARALRGLLAGELRIGTVSGLDWEPLIEALARLHDAHPGLEVRLLERDSSGLVEGVREGKFDVALATWAGPAPEDLVGTIVADDRLIAAVSLDHPWAGRGSVSVPELLTAPLICPPRGSGSRDALDAAAARAGLTFEPRWEASTPVLARRLAVRALGVAVASESALRGWADSVAICIEDEEARSRLGVVHRPSPGPAAAAFLALLP